jgi:acetone carboxylase gamma subunit
MHRIRVTEYLDLDIQAEIWVCHSCGNNLKSAHENYKRGCLVFERDPRTVHPALIKGKFTFCPDPDWVRILEFYCPHCGRQIESEYLPPGHPITHDIELDIGSLQRRFASGELSVEDGRLTTAREREGAGG